MPYPSLLHPAIPKSAPPRAPTPYQSTIDPYLHRRYSNTILSQSLWGLWVLVRTRFVWALWVSLAGMGFDSKGNLSLLSSCWGFSAFGCVVSPHSHASTRILEWIAFPYSRGSSWPRNQTRVSCIAGRFFTNWAIRDALSLKRWGYYEEKSGKTGVNGSTVERCFTDSGSFYTFLKK